MPIKISDDFMCLEIHSQVIAIASRRAGRLVGSRALAAVLRPHQAITALTITELLASGRDSSDPVVTALREELR